MNDSISKDFSITEAVRYGWEMVKDHLALLAGATAILVLVSFGFGVLGDAVNSAGLSILIGLASWVVQSLFSVGYIYLAIRLYRGEAAEYRDLIAPTDRLWSYIGASILYGLIMVAVVVVGFVIVALLGWGVFGLTAELAQSLTAGSGAVLGVIALAFIVAAVYLGIRLSLYSYTVVEDEQGPIESLKRSWAITDGAVWNLFLLSFLLGIINFIGLLLLGIGVLVTAPIALLATTSVYFILKEAT